MKKATRKTKKQSGNVGIQVGGGEPTAHTLLVVAELGKHLARAIELGRETTAVRIVEVLAETGGVKNVSITGCAISMPA